MQTQANNKATATNECKLTNKQKNKQNKTQNKQKTNKRQVSKKTSKQTANKQHKTNEKNQTNISKQTNANVAAATVKQAYTSSTTKSCNNTECSLSQYSSPNKSKENIGESQLIRTKHTWNA